MSERDTKVALGEILESIAAIRSYTDGVSKEEFTARALLQDAVIRRLEIVGEAANQIPNDVRSQFPEIEWRAITAMRNRLIHGYFSVNTEVVWNTIQQDLTVLETHARTILRQLESGAQPG